MASLVSVSPTPFEQTVPLIPAAGSTHITGTALHRDLGQAGRALCFGWVLQLSGITPLHLAAALPQGISNVTGKEQRKHDPCNSAETGTAFPHVRGQGQGQSYPSFKLLSNKDTDLSRYPCVSPWYRLCLF